MSKPSACPPVDDEVLPAAEQALLECAQSLVPALVQRAGTTNGGRDLPQVTVDDYHRAGILRVLQPRRFGGHQLRFTLFSRIVETLAQGCASSAWVYAVLCEHQWLIASFPLQAQIDVWGETPQAVASSSLAPRATATREADGWRLSGQYPFSSGSSHAQWVIVGASLAADENPRPVGYLLLPMDAIELIDDWHVLGLAGTGSRSFRVKDVFVPEHRCVRYDDLMAGRPPGAQVHPDYPLLRAPRGLLVNYSLPPVSIALSQRALEIAIATLRGRVSRGLTRLAASEFVQVAVGEAAAAIDTAGLILRAGRRSAEALIAGGEPIDVATVLRARRDVTYAQHQAQWGVERLVEVCGARSVYDSDPLGLIRRDMLTMLTHNVASRQVAMGGWGRLALDVETEQQA